MIRRRRRRIGLVAARALPGGRALVRSLVHRFLRLPLAFREPSVRNGAGGGILAGRDSSLLWRALQAGLPSCVFLATLFSAGCQGSVGRAREGSSLSPSAAVTAAATPLSSTGAPTSPSPQDRPLVLTYFFYWYDAYAGQHLREADGLREHFPPGPAPSYRSVAWFQQQLKDMSYAGIDVVLPVYWGFGREQWSTEGLSYLALARQEMMDAGQPAPQIGMFFDTTIIDGRDLTTPDGKEFLYQNFRDFFSRIPRHQWALIDGRPAAFLFTSDRTAAVDQTTFDYVYDSFQRDFGVHPYIVREISWDYPFRQPASAANADTRVRDWDHPIRTDDSYLWGAAQNGYAGLGGVAEVGPGYDDSLVPGRHGVVRARENGWWYRRNFEAAIASGKRLLAIETWNEVHEGSEICETVEYGRQYLDLTRELTTRFHERGAPSVLRQRDQPESS